MACVDVCIAAVQMAPGLGPLSNRDLSSGEVRAGRHLWMTGSNSVKGTLIDKYAFLKRKPLRTLSGTVQPRRRGGRPPPTRRANPNPRPRRTRRPAGTLAPTATGTRTARQSRQQPNANSPPRAGQATQPGARPPTGTSHRSATLATSKIPPKVEPTVMRLNGRD